MKISLINKEERADVGSLTIEQKANILTGAAEGGDNLWDPNDKCFQTKGAPEVGYEPIKMGHGPQGIRVGRERDVRSPLFASPIGQAASWDPGLSYRIAVEIAELLRERDHSVNLAPTVNIVRNPLGGRTFESYSEDPLLSGEMGKAFVRGTQSRGVAVSLKHYLCNNQETHRFELSVNPSEQALHEIFLPAFKTCIQEGRAWSVMAAYPKFRGTYCCESKLALQRILRDTFGFDGVVVSDFTATHSTVASLEAGCDVEMHAGRYYGDRIVDAVLSGELDEAVVDRSVGRVSKLMERCAMTQAEVGPPTVDRERIQNLLDESARKSLVLLKNDDAFLPFSNGKKRVAVIGPNASLYGDWPEGEERFFLQGGGSAAVWPEEMIDFVEGLNLVGDGEVDVSYAQGSPLYDEEFSTEGVSSLRLEAVAKAKEADVVVLALGLSGISETEGEDRESMRLPRVQEELVAAVSDANASCVAVVVAGTAVAMESWIDKVQAVLFGFYPGRSTGQAVAEVLLGRKNPCGKLPISFPREDSPYLTETISRTVNADYPEGLFVGYRWFSSKGLDQVLFPFGHGLHFGDAKVQRGAVRIDGDDIVVEFTVQNAGALPLEEVVQLYSDGGREERPRRELRAFKRVTVEGGGSASATIRFPVNRLSEYDVEAGGWSLKSGVEHTLLIGGSSADLRVTGKICVGAESISVE